jgi:hypothetical protein
VKSKHETDSTKSHVWTMVEIKTLRNNSRLGARAIMALINGQRDESRTPLTLGAVYSKAHSIGVSLRRQGSRRGRRFALPASMRIGDVGPSADLVRTGRIDMATVKRNVIADAHGELTLCPHCGKRPATVKNTGLCEPCHLVLLIAHLDDAADAIVAKRPHWVAQQRVSRLKKQDIASELATLREAAGAAVEALHMAGNAFFMAGVEPGEIGVDGRAMSCCASAESLLGSLL